MIPTLASVVRVLGGELYAGGRQASIAGPGHSPSDRSVSLRLTPDGRVLIHCFAGDDWREVSALLLRSGLVDRSGRLIGSVREEHATDRSLTERRRAAVELWDAGQPIAGTLSERHLWRRAIRRPGGERLRHYGLTPVLVYQDAGARRPALLALLTDAEDRPCGLEVTYLSSSGDKALMRTPRKLVGLSPAGAAVRLDRAGDTLLVAEGVATALSASEVFGLPAWALLSAGKLQRWTPPPEVGRVVIAADSGEVGMTAARILMDRVRMSGRNVEIASPPTGYGDWNEAAAAV